MLGNCLGSEKGPSSEAPAWLFLLREEGQRQKSEVAVSSSQGGSICSRKCEGTRTREPFPATRLRKEAFPPPKLKEIKESSLMEACWWSSGLSVMRLSRESNGSELKYAWARR